MIYRIGNGFDFHRFETTKTRPFILGGLELDVDVSIKAHSDGDVLLHSVSDAILGSLALGDIGDYFPDTSKDCKDIDSKIILNKAHNFLIDQFYQIENIDLTVITQKPKISPLRVKIRQSVANLLHLDLSQVSLKATTMEKTGAIGREEGICVMSSILIKKIK